MFKQIALPNWYVISSILASLGIVLFLFYVDEGYYSFKWMLEPGAWFVFFIYWNLFFWPMIGVGFLSKFLANK